MIRKLKVLLVDDEKPVRAAVRYLLDTLGQAEFEILEAKNGREGFRIFSKESPDIVILDINMPQMSGIELLEKLEDKIGNAKIIVISGYNEFQFVQKAIQYSVIGYLLKPINRQEFYAVMERVLKVIHHDSTMNTKLLQVDKEKRVRLLRKIIGGTLHTMDAYTDCVEKLSKYEIFAIGIMRWNFDKVLEEKYVDCPEELDSHKVYGFIDDFLKNKCNAISFESKNQENILFVYGYENRNQLLKILRVLQMAFCEKYGTKLFVSLGSDVFLVEQIRESYCLAKEDMGKRNLLSMDNMSVDQLDMSWEDIRSKNLLENYRISIRNCYTKSDGRKLEDVLNDFFEQVKSYQHCSVNQAELFLRQFILIVDEFYLINGEEKSASAYLPDWQFRIHQICNFKDFEELMLYAGRVTINKKKRGEIDLKWVLEDIKNQLDTNYTELLQLDDLAKSYSFTKQYLNKMFKKEYQYPIHEYLLKTRMERAAYLLKNTSMDIKEITVSVGYSDQSYFSKVFKKHFGVSPNTYREK